MSWPALLSWGIAILVALIIQKDGPIYSLLLLIRLDSVANIVGKLGVLHLFFLFVPVWFLTALLYIVFAVIAGAGRKFPDQTQTPQDEVSGPSGSQGRAEPQAVEGARDRDMVLWVFAIVAVLSLAACFVLPIWVYASGGGYEQNMATFKRILIWPTLVYFVSGTVWAIKRNKAKSVLSGCVIWKTL